MRLAAEVFYLRPPVCDGNALKGHVATNVPGDFRRGRRSRAKFCFRGDNANRFVHWWFFCVRCGRREEPKKNARHKSCNETGLSSIHGSPRSNAPAQRLRSYRREVAHFLSEICWPKVKLLLEVRQFEATSGFDAQLAIILRRARIAADCAE